MSDDKDSQFKWGILACYGLHLAVIGIFAFGIIGLHYRPKGGFLLFHQGGDEKVYLAQARMLLSGRLKAAIYPFGFPLLLAPFAAVLRGWSTNAITSAVSVFWGLIMFPIGQFLLGSVALQATGKRRVALGAVAIWTLLPLLAYPFLALVFNSTIAETWSTHLMWLQMLSDGPATFFAILIMWVLVRGPNRPGELKWAVTLGALAGFATLIRLTGVVMLLVVLIALFAKRRVSAGVAALGTAIIVLAPQVIYNIHFFSGPLTTGYEVITKAPPTQVFGLAALGNNLSILSSRTGPAIFLLAIPFAVIALGGLVPIMRKEWFNGLAIGLWLGGYLAIYGLYTYSWLHFAAYLMPAYPAAVLLVAGFLGWVPGIFASTRKQRSTLL